MNFLNKDNREARWLSIVLGILTFMSYGFAEYNSASSLARSMGMLMGVEMNSGYFTLFIIVSAGLSFLMFVLFVSLAYSLAYRTLVNKTRDIKVMPISKECYMNHVEFIMVIVNVILGALGFGFAHIPLQSAVVEMIVAFVLKALGYLAVLFLLCRVGVGSDVKKKIFGGFLTPIAVLVALMI